jgi:hypothetical protein
VSAYSGVLNPSADTSSVDNIIRFNPVLFKATAKELPADRIILPATLE